MVPLSRRGQEEAEAGVEGNASCGRSENPAELPVINSLIRYLATSCPAANSASVKEELCWETHIANTESVVARNDLFTLVRCFLQAPATQLVTRRQVGSLQQLGEVCQTGRGNVMLSLLRKKSSDVESGEEVLRFNRILRAGLVSALELEQEEAPLILPHIGNVLRDMGKRVIDFYKFYGSVAPSQCTAAKYAYNWGSADREVLREEFMKIPLAKRLETEVRNDYVTACRTGGFFPAHEQVRPMPFNEELKQRKGVREEDIFGVCSKNYTQKNKSFTPGALTFCCSCTHPIIMGFKILSKNEGPRSVLDVLISSMPKLPRQIIYDFACGFYSSAAHTLWWAIEDSTITSDAFHSFNHNCSPSFYPTGHDNLNMTNTVSHEQKNAGITEIEKSLRYTSQEKYVGLLAYQVCILNIKRLAKGSPRFTEREVGLSENDQEWAYFHCLGLQCVCCSTKAT